MSPPLYVPVGRSRGVALAVSIAGHALLVLSLSWTLRSASPREPTHAPRVDASPLPAIVWVAGDGFDGGGGSGGRDQPSPPQQARRPGDDLLTTPVATPTNPLAPTSETPTEAPGLDIPAVQMASALDSLPGAIRPLLAAPTAPGARGPGIGDGIGGRRGTGEGDGDGDGLGDGGPRGAGDGPYRMDAGGLTPPIPLHRGTPRYTPAAVQARVQGAVLVECIVQPTGRCTDLRVVRSMQPPLGLDREALVAAGEWRFKPGVVAGEQVPVLVTIEVAFSIR